MSTTTRWLAWLVLATLMLMLPPANLARAGPSIAAPFREYYAQHEGIRVLGTPLTDLFEIDGYPAQYFEKGRLEDHHADAPHPDWVFMYGRLTAELIEIDEPGAVSSTSITYADLRYLNDPAYRQPPPSGFTGGVMPVREGMFVPYDPQLRVEDGYIVPPYFWTYINRADLFPAGWLHDIGLPMSDAVSASTFKDGEQRMILMQAFERTVLTYDARNPAGWQIERGNIGADALHIHPVAEGPIEIPAHGAQVTLPLHILARVGDAGQQVSATLRWSDGNELSRVFTVLRGEDGRGLAIGSLDWGAGRWRPPDTQPAVLELRDTSGVLLAHQRVRVLAPTDQDVLEITLYWVHGENIWPLTRHIPKTARIGAAALNELLWGPDPRDAAFYTTALPTPEQVLSYPGRDSDWGPRVTLRSLSIRDGMATADFSRELWAYEGGPQPAGLMHEQIAHTLKQFPAVRRVQIAIEGEIVAVLEP